MPWGPWTFIGSSISASVIQEEHCIDTVECYYELSHDDNGSFFVHSKILLNYSILKEVIAGHIDLLKKQELIQEFEELGFEIQVLKRVHWIRKPIGSYSYTVFCYLF